MSKNKIAHFAAAASLGLLIGMLTGLSISPIVAVVMGALIAAAVAYLGLQGEAAKPPDVAPKMELEHDRGALPRILGFGLFATVGLLAGLCFRTHDTFSPSVKSQLRTWVDAGYPEADARAIVRFRSTGLVPSGETVAAERSTAALPSVLYAGSASDRCSDLDPKRYKDAAAVVEAYRREPEKVWGKIADLAEKRCPPEDQLAVLRFLWKMQCER